MFEEFLNKYVRIRQADGFTKFGFLVKIENGFLFIRFESGRLTSVFEKEIVGIDEVEIRREDDSNG